MSDSIVADGTPLGKMRGAGDAAGGAGFDAAASASRRFRFGDLPYIKKIVAQLKKMKIAAKIRRMKGTSGNTSRTSGVATDGVTRVSAKTCAG